MVNLVMKFQIGQGGPIVDGWHEDCGLDPDKKAYVSKFKIGDREFLSEAPLADLGETQKDGMKRLEIDRANLIKFGVWSAKIEETEDQFGTFF